MNLEPKNFPYIAAPIQNSNIVNKIRAKHNQEIN